MKAKRVIIVVLIIAAVCATLLFFVNNKFRLVNYTAPEYTEITKNIDNPYNGWYQILSYTLSENPLDLYFIENKRYGPELMLIEVDLKNYRSEPLSDNALKALNSLFSACRLKGKQLIVRFLYDSSGNSEVYEPDDISVILTHMTQTSEVINQYSDCIYILQGLYIGAWGEMHTTAYDKPEDLITLADHLNSLIDPSIFLAVRTPSLWRTVTRSNEPLTSDSAFNGTLISRLGLFNDGMLGSETDLGTYSQNGGSIIVNSEKKHNRIAELAFQNKLCNYAPNGGEVVIDNPYNDFTTAVQYLRQTHVSYLNSEYDMDVLQKWAETNYDGEGAYNGINGFEYIGSHLGYRYIVRSSELIYPHPWSESAYLSISIENAGFSPSYRKFDVSLLMRNTETGEEYIVPVDTDTRFWSSSEQTNVEIPIEIRSYPDGSYNLYLNTSDPLSGYQIYFANEGALTSDGVPLGSVSIRQFADF